MGRAEESSEAAPGPEGRVRQIGNWRLAETLGRGGAGVVFAATHIETGASGALKVAREDRGAIGTHLFAREAKHAARLRHPHIVALLEHGWADDGAPFLVYERVLGRSLEDAVDWLDLTEVVRIGAELLEALSYAHDAGVVHCDVTPPNVLLDSARANAVRLTDFGLAKARDEAAVRHRIRGIQISGTPGYLSPEQARGVGSPGPATDLFGCGAVLYRALTGYAPYGGESPMEVVQRTLTSAPLPLRPREGLRAPVRLAEVVQRLLARDPEHRYPSAARAREAWLEAARAHTPVRGTMRSSLPLAPGLQSLETILVAPLRSTPIGRETPFSTVRATPSAGLDRRRLGRRFAPSPMPRPAAREQALEALLPQPNTIVGVTGSEGMGQSDLLDAVRDGLRGKGVQVCLVRGRSGVRYGGRCAPFEALATAMLDAIGAATISPLRVAADLLIERIKDVELEATGWGVDALIGGLVGIGPTGARGSAVMEAFRVCEALLEPDRRPVVLMFDEAEGIDESTWQVACALVQRQGGGVGLFWAGTEGAGLDRVLEGTAVLEGTTTLIELGSPPDAVLDATWRAWSDSESRRPEGVDAPADLAAHAAVFAQVGVGGLDAYVAACGVPERALLEAACTFGGDVPSRGLIKVASQLAAPHPVTEEVILEARRARLIVDVHGSAARRERWVRVPSPALRERVLAGMDPSAKKHARALAAQWLARTCVDDSASNQARIATLASAAGIHGSAAHAWGEAARIELESDRPRAAAHYLERALAIEMEHAVFAVDRPKLHLHLAMAALDAGRPEEVRAHADAALETLESIRHLLRAQIATVHAEAFVQLGELDEALAQLDTALATLGDDGDPMELARAHALMGWVLGYRLGRNDEGIRHGRRALEVAARINAPAFRASLCGRLGANYLRAGDWDGQLDTNREDLKLSTEARDVGGIVRAHINLGVCFHNRGALGLAREHTQTACSLALRCGVTGAAQIATNNLAMIALDDDRSEDVHRHVATVFEMAERTGYRRALPETLITAARLDTRRGQLASAKAKLERVAATGDTIDLEMAHRAHALLELARGSATDALTRMQRVIESDESDPYERAASRITLATVLRRLGHEHEAAAEERRADEVFLALGAAPDLERARWGTVG